MPTDREKARSLALSTIHMLREIKGIQLQGMDHVTVIILRHCATQSGARVSDIASVVEVNPSSITRRIQALEKEGLIRLSKDPADQRSVLVEITTEGKQRLSDYFEQVTGLFASLVMDWESDEVEAFTESMTRFADNMRIWKQEHINVQVNGKDSLR